MPEDAKQRLINNLAGGLARVSREDIIERAISHFRNADLDYGARLTKAVTERRKR